MCEIAAPQRFGCLIGMPYVELDGWNDPRPIRLAWECCKCKCTVEQKNVRGQQCPNCYHQICLARPTAEQLEKKLAEANALLDRVFASYEVQGR